MEFLPQSSKIMKRAQTFPGSPRRDVRRPTFSSHDRFAEKFISASGDGYAYPVNLQIVQPFYCRSDHIFIAPSNQPVSSGAIKEIMLAGPLPYEVPTVLRVDAYRPAAMAVCYMKTSA